jgi:hypothetical protein
VLTANLLDIEELEIANMVDLLDEEEDWGRVKMGRFSDADEKLVRRMMGNGFLKKGRPSDPSSRQTVSGKRHRSGMTIQVAANRVNCIAQGHSHVHTPQAIVKAVSTRKTIAATKFLLSYVSRTRADDELDGLYGSVTMHDALGRELSTAQTLGAIDTWELLPNSENLSKRAREKIADGDRHAVRRMPDDEKYYYVQAHHFVLSVNESGDDPVVVNQFHAAVKSTVRTMFAKHGYRCIWGMHDGHTENLHAHLIVKAVSNYGERLRSDKAGNFLDEFRLEFSNCLKLTGLNYDATRRVDRRATLERIMAGAEQLKSGRHIWQKDMQELFLGADTIHRLNTLKQLKDNILQDTNGMQHEKRIGRASATIREALNKPPAQSLWQRIAGKFHTDDIPPEYHQLAEALRPAFHDPAQAIAIWQNMAMQGGYQDQNGRVQYPNWARANWELCHRPELFENITSRACDLKKDAGFRKILKQAPLPRPEITSEQVIDPELVTRQRIKSVRKDRRGAITSLEHLLNEVEGINPESWWGDVVRTAISQAAKIEIGSRRVLSMENLDPQSRSIPLAPKNGASIDQSMSHTDLDYEPPTNQDTQKIPSAPQKRSRTRGER